MPGFPVPDHLPEFAQVHVHWIDDAIQSPHPLYPLLLLPSNFPSIRVFSNESAIHIRWPKRWTLSLSFSISPSKEYSGLISFKIDWFDFLAFQWILKGLLQHHSPKASIFQCPAFFIVQLSHPYMIAIQQLSSCHHNCLTKCLWFHLSFHWASCTPIYSTCWAGVRVWVGEMSTQSMLHLKIYIYLFGCVQWVLIAALGIFVASYRISHCGVQAL